MLKLEIGEISLDQLLRLVFIAPSLIIGLTFHEFMHGYVADKLGDPTPRHAGRLTLNPIKHLDILGSIMLFIMQFGWAKPVPVNPVYFKNPRQDMMWVALAGPGANFLVAVVLAFFLKATYFALPQLLASLIYVTIQINIILALFNLIPIPPLDGSKVLARFLPDSMMDGFYKLEQFGFFILIFIIMVLGISPIGYLKPVIDLINNVLGV